MSGGGISRRINGIQRYDTRAAILGQHWSDTTARDLMAKGERPTVDGVREALGRGSPNHIAKSMRQFWKNQAAVTTGNPLALTHLPPELADAAVAKWEKALSLAQQTAQVDDSAARAHLEQLRRETTQHARAIELREKDWDLAARVRERALVEARDQINVLLKELAADRGFGIAARGLPPAARARGHSSRGVTSH
jgi:hypothetical protein